MLNIKLYNLFIDGQGMVAEVFDFKPSSLKVKEEAYDTAASDTPQMMDMGLEPMSCEFKVKDWGKAARFFGKVGSPTRFRLEAAKEDNGNWQSERHILEGYIRELTPEVLKRGAGTVTNIKVSLTYNQVIIAGQETVCIDTNPANPCRIIDGTDYLAKAKELAQIG